MPSRAETIRSHNEGMTKKKQYKYWKCATNNRVAYHVINMTKMSKVRKRQNFTDSAKIGSSTSVTSLISTESDSNVYEERLTAKKSKRHLTKATFGKWKQIYEHEYQMLSWLNCKTDKRDSTVCFMKFAKNMKTTFAEC